MARVIIKMQYQMIKKRLWKKSEHENSLFDLLEIFG